MQWRRLYGSSTRQGVELGEAHEELKAFVEKSGIPVARTLMGLSAFPTDHPLCVGMLGMHGNYGPNVNTNKCDLLIAVGMRFSDRVTGKISTYAKQAKVIHIDIDHAEINKNVRADVPIVGDCKEVLAGLTALVQPRVHDEWVNSFAQLNAIEYERVIDKALNPADGPLLMGEVARKVSEATANKAILVTDVGQSVTPYAKSC